METLRQVVAKEKSQSDRKPVAHGQIREDGGGGQFVGKEKKSGVWGCSFSCAHQLGHERRELEKGKNRREGKMRKVHLAVENEWKRSGRLTLVFLVLLFCCSLVSTSPFQMDGEALKIGNHVNSRAELRELSKLLRGPVQNKL